MVKHTYQASKYGKTSVSARVCDPSHPSMSITPHDQRQQYLYLLTVNYCCCLNYSDNYYVHSYELKIFTLFTFTMARALPPSVHGANRIQLHYRYH